MCTTFAKQINGSWHLGKTRDPVEWMRWDDEIKLFDAAGIDSVKKLIIQNPDPRQDGYYGGINELGVAFTSTYVHVAENQISYIRKPYIRLILEAKTAQEAVEVIKAFNPKIGGNMFVADKKACFGIESSPTEYFIEKIVEPTVKTNHYLHLPNRNLSFDKIEGFEAWSHTHQERAEELLKTANSLKDLESILTDRKYAEQNQAICTTAKEEPCYTHSAMIFDTDTPSVSYAQGNPLEVGFKKYNF